MKTIIKEIDSALRGFINDSRHNLLIVGCAVEHSPLLMKSLEAIEDDPASPDIFLTFGHPFENSRQYVDAVMESLRDQLAAVNQQLSGRGAPELALLPEETADAELAPEARLAVAVTHLRKVVPRSRQIVWVFYPLEIDESPEGLDQYLRLAGQTRRHVKDQRLRGVKLLIRDGDSHTLLRGLKDEPDTRFYLPALDPDSISRKLNEAANDPRIAHQEQAQIHMMLAGIDVSKGNFETALARNEELLGYFYHSGQQHHQSVVLSNIGDIHYLQGRFDAARVSYERAVLISAEQQSVPLVTYQSINLGNSLMMQERYDEALSYYESAEKLAEANKTLPYQLQAIERIGDLKYKAGSPGEAGAAWEKGAELCRKFEYDAGMRPFLDRLLNLFRESGDTERLNDCRKALAELARKQ
jgi:tetratricopeptide (TPR) repeat protein